MSDNTPTERFDAPQAASAAPAERRPNRFLYLLIALGLALLLALIVVVVLMLSRGTGQLVAAQSPSPNPGISDGPSVSESPEPSLGESEHPSDSPSASQTKAAPAPDTKPHFTTFTVPKSESGCSKGPNYSNIPTVKVKWVAVNAKSVWFVQGTDDAANSGANKLPTSGNQDNFENGAPQFPCNGQPATYTLTIVGTDGSHFSKQWTVTDKSNY